MESDKNKRQRKRSASRQEAPQREEEEHAHEVSGQSANDDLSDPTSRAVQVPERKRKRKSKLFGSKKPDDMPRRPLSAYNLYFKAMRAQMVEEAAAADGTDPKISFEDTARAIARRWKSLPPEDLERYKALAAADTDRYHREMEEYQRELARKARVERERMATAASAAAAARPPAEPAGTAVSQPGMQLMQNHSAAVPNLSNDLLTPLVSLLLSSGELMSNPQAVMQLIALLSPAPPPPAHIQTHPDLSNVPPGELLAEILARLPQQQPQVQMQQLAHPQVYQPPQPAPAPPAPASAPVVPDASQWLLQQLIGQDSSTILLLQQLLQQQSPQQQPPAGERNGDDRHTRPA